MSAILQDRNGCALQGAAALLQSVGGVVPVLHANAGCSVARGAGDGSRGNGIASTTLLERHVVFGGTSRLREQLKNTLQVRAGELFVVLSGCVPEVIGDDVPAMLKEAREQQFPAFSLAVPGFGGHAWRGFACAARALIEHAPAVLGTAPDARAADVNLLGPAPGLDPSWDADLQEIEDILAELGLRSRRLIGLGQHVIEWQAAPRARLSVVLSPWGLDAAQWLERQHAVPLLDAGWLPVGSRDAGELLVRIGAALGIAADAVSVARSRLDARLRHVLRDAAARGWLDDLPTRAAIVGPSAAAVGQARFLVDTLGVPVVLVVVTDKPHDARRAALQSALAPAHGANVVFAESAPEIAAAVSAASPDLLIGSAFEAPIARALDAAHLEAAAPTWRHRRLGRTFVGVRGAIALTEDLIAAMRIHAEESCREPPAAPATGEAFHALQ